MNKLFKTPQFLAGFIIFSVLLIFTLAGIFYLPCDPLQTDTQNKFLPFSLNHLLGTDYLGRDVFSRILYGLRISLSIGFSAMIFGLFFGLILGSVSGFSGGTADLIISKLVNTLMSFPGILMALMLAAVSKPGIRMTVIAIGIMSIPRYTRIIRSGFLSCKNQPYIKAAKCRGASSLRLMYIHILPNILSEILITATITFSLSILSESGLSYLGLGVQPPYPSFGRMINDAQRYIFTNPQGVFVPVIILILLVFSLNLMSGGISKAAGK